MNDPLADSIVVGMTSSPQNPAESLAYLGPSGLLRYSETVRQGSGDRYDLTGIEDRARAKLSIYLSEHGEPDKEFQVRFRRAYLDTGIDGEVYLVTMLEEC